MNNKTYFKPAISRPNNIYKGGQCIYESPINKSLNLFFFNKRNPMVKDMDESFFSSSYLEVIVSVDEEQNGVVSQIELIPCSTHQEHLRILERTIRQNCVDLGSWKYFGVEECWEFICHLAGGAERLPYLQVVDANGQPYMDDKLKHLYGKVGQYSTDIAPCLLVDEPDEDTISECFINESTFQLHDLMQLISEYTSVDRSNLLSNLFNPSGDTNEQC